MTNTVFENLLAHSKETGALIGIRKYHDGDNFWLGYIVHYNEKLIVLQHYSRFGVEDGLVIEKIENIESIDSQNDHLKAFKKLIGGDLGGQRMRDLELSDADNWQYEALCLLMDSDRIITIESIMRMTFVTD